MCDPRAIRLDRAWRAALPLRRHTDVKEAALYAEDSITKGPFSINIGIRGDFYNGLQATTRQAEPRVGVAYNIKKTRTVFRISYAHTMESPFNENLIFREHRMRYPIYRRPDGRRASPSLHNRTANAGDSQ